MAPDGTGGWYLGGDFRSVGGVPRTDLAHVMSDGTLDPNLAPTTNGLVRALAVGTDAVFAGGEFSAANGVPRGNLAGFTAATGALTGFVGSVSFASRRRQHPVRSARRPRASAHRLDAVRGRRVQPGAERRHATRLRGAAFNSANSQIQAWNPSTNRLINGLARDSDGTDVFIGGRFSRVNVNPADPFNTGQTRSAVAKVDEAAGTADPNWVTPLQPSTDLTTLMVFGSRVYVAGTVRVAPAEIWPVAAYNTANNNAGLNVNWHPVPAGASSRSRRPARRSTSGAARSSTGCRSPRSSASTRRTSLHGTPSFAPALGRGRQALPSGQSTGVRAIGANGSDVVAGGTFTNVGGVERRNLAAIDLNTGQPTGFNPPMKGQFSALASVNAVALTDDGLVWAGGDFVTEGPNERTRLAAFDAGSGAIASFHRDPSGVRRRLGARRLGVDRLRRGRLHPGRWAAQAQHRGVQERPRRGRHGAALRRATSTARCERSRWPATRCISVARSRSVNGSLAALKRDRRNLAAVDATTGLARDWDPDADNAVRALAVAGDTVFAGGEFGMVNRSTPRQRLAAFDAQSGTARAWDPSADAPVRSLALYGPTVFAGGDFANVNGGVPRAGIAALDAQTGASDPLSVDLSPEERSGPLPPVARVDALVRVAADRAVDGRQLRDEHPDAADGQPGGFRAPAAAAARRRRRHGRRHRSGPVAHRLPAPVRRGSRRDARGRDRYRCETRTPRAARP